ncbi:MAG: glycosyl hydrolase [Bacteroidota bacterium]|nr:glycosyl hydrolase [Bacteroidota bacterium]
MRKHLTLFLLFISCCLLSFGQTTRTTITLPEGVVTVSSYTNDSIVINGKTDLHLTALFNPLVNSIINLNSEDSWVIIDNIRPATVVSSLLSSIYVNGQAAALNTNVRVSMYKQGTVIIPQSSTFQPLTVYNDQNFTGTSQKYSLFTFYNSLGAMDNKIQSFKLKRGYMVTMATKSDGTGYSRCFIADNSDLEVPVMPELLDQKVSFIRVFAWNYVSKKGYCSSDATPLNKVNATWGYDWSAYGATTANFEYVPMHAKLTWAPFTQINSLQFVTQSLGFNEPDHPEQHKDDNGGKALTVSQALAQWPDMIKSGLRLGAPSCTDANWLYAFMDSCKAKNYRVDFVGWHAYWGGKSPQNWYNDLKAIHDRTGRPIWITEWNNGANWTNEYWPTSDHSLSPANAAKQLSDIKGILQVLDTAHFVERYAIYDWVQDCRAMILADTLTPAGKYYAADNAPMAFNRVNEVIPTFNYGTPSLSISFSVLSKKSTISVFDPNFENYSGMILEKKMDNGEYVELFNTDNHSTVNYLDTLDLNAASKIRYRVRSKLPGGLLSAYSNEVGYDVTSGTSDVHYGNLSLGNVDWNTVFFKQGITNPVVIMGSPTNKNISVLLCPRTKLISASSRFGVQLAPWSYQGVSSLSNEEKISYFITNKGTYDLGGLKVISDRVTGVSGSWVSVTFPTAFDTIPVVLTSEYIASSTFPVTTRIRNVTKTGFQVKLQKESKVTAALPTETVSYMAITPGVGSYNNDKITVGRTGNTVGTTYSSILYGDSVANPIFLPQMQTCNDDTVTATLRCLTIGIKSATIVKQRERSYNQATTAAAETVGWILIKPAAISQGVDVPSTEGFKIYPNPVRDYLYLNIADLGTLNVEIYNMVGAMVKRLSVMENQIDVRDLPAGCYILRTSYGTKKFVKL